MEAGTLPKNKRFTSNDLVWISIKSGQQNLLKLETKSLQEGGFSKNNTRKFGGDKKDVPLSLTIFLWNQKLD